MHERSRPRCEEPRSQLEKAVSKPGQLVAPGVCPTFSALAFRGSTDGKNRGRNSIYLKLFKRRKSLSFYIRFRSNAQDYFLDIE